MKRATSASALLLAHQLWAASVSTENLAFSIDPSNLAFENMTVCGTTVAGTGGVAFLDGESETLLTPTSVAIEAQSNDVLCRHGFAGDSTLAAKQMIVACADHVRCCVEVANSSDRERWIEVTLALPVSDLAASEYWNGLKAYAALDRPISRSDMAGLFPLSALYAKHGIALGIAADQMRSYLRAELNPAERRISYSTRMVLDPGGSDTITFVAYGFHCPFAWRDAVQLYYNIFPAVFQPRDDIDPRINEPCVRYFFWERGGSRAHIKDNPRNTFELLRRTHSFGTDWCYAGACGARTGDMWPSDHTLNWKTWKPDRKTGGKIDVIWDQAMIREYLESRSSRLRKGDEYNTAAMAYMVPTFCEEGLAKQHFPECILEPKDPRVRMRYEPWVYRTQSCLRVYAYGNRYGEKLLADLDRLAEEWPWLPGFAFDCGAPPIPHFGAGARATPGRAYEKGKGVYALNATAVVKVADKVHSLTNAKGHRMGVIINLDGSECYQCWFAADAAIYEAPPQHHLYGYDPIHLRLWLGKKPFTWWKFYIVPSRDTKSQEELIGSVQGLIDYTLLSSLHLGAFPNPYFVVGVPKMIHYLPVLREFQRLGWEPAPGFAAADTLWHSRYGKGLGCCIVAGNYQVEPVKTDVALMSSYLGPGAHIMAEYQGRRTRCSVENGRTMVRDETIGSGEALILRAVARTEANADGLTTVSQIDLPDGQDGTISIDIDSPRPSSCALEIWCPPGRYATQLLANGQVTRFQALPGKVSCQLPLRKGTDHLRLSLAPEIVVEDRDALLAYPFVENDQPNCEILLGKSPSAQEELYAVWLWNYFRFYHHVVLKRDLQRQIPVRKGASAAHGRRILLGTPETNPALAGQLLTRHRGKIAVAGDDVIVVADSLPALKETVLTFLRTLDVKYEFHGYFAGVGTAVGAVGAAGVLGDPFRPGVGSERMGIATTGGYVPWCQTP